MPSSTSAMAIAPVEIVNAGNPRAQAMKIASLILVTDVAFCQNGAAAIAAAVAEALAPEATVDSVLKTSITYLKSRSGEEVRSLITAAPELAGEAGDYKAFRERHHGKFRQRIACDSRETVPASLAIVRLAGGIRGWPPVLAPISGTMRIRSRAWRQVSAARCAVWQPRMRRPRLHGQNPAHQGAFRHLATGAIGEGAAAVALIHQYLAKSR